MIKRCLKIIKDIKAVEKKITTNTNLIKRTEKEKTFFETHDECPKCTQSITKQLKKFHIEENQQTIDTSEDYLQELDDEIITIGVGDNENDIEMIKKSNYPCLVKNDNFNSSLINIDNLIKSSQLSPLGWADVIKTAIQKIES